MDRTKKFTQVCLERQLDAVLIHSKTNKQYLGALTGSGVKVLITKDKVYQIMDGRYINEAKIKTPTFNNIVYKQGSSYIDAVKEIVGTNAVIGIEGNHVSACEYHQMLQSNLNIELLSNDLEIIRRCKDENEIACIKEACKITDQVFEELLKLIKVGMSEIEIANHIEFLAKQNGATSMAFDTIVVSGTRGALPHGRPTSKRVEKNEMVTIDFGVVYHGYQSDMTRTICIGKPKDELKKIYDIVCHAQCAGIQYIKPGITGKEVDQYVRDIIEKAGYGKYFTHGLGHGIGLGGGELPLLNQYSETVLEEGMVMSCEPGIYIPNVGGVRIEDDVVIQNGKAVVLNQTTKKLIILKED